MQLGEQMRIPEAEGNRAQPLSSKGNVSLERDTGSLIITVQTCGFGAAACRAGI